MSGIFHEVCLHSESDYAKYLQEYEKSSERTFTPTPVKCQLCAQPRKRTYSSLMETDDRDECRCVIL